MSNVVEELVEKATWAARTVTKHRWLALNVAALAAIACAAGIASISDRYEATAVIYVDTQTVLRPMMTDLTYQPDIDQQVRMLARTLISRPNVERIVRAPQLGLDVADLAEREKVVSRLMTQIRITPTSGGSGGGNLYEISYRDASPHLARRLVDVTVEMFRMQGAGAKEHDSLDAGRFIESQIATYEAKLTAAENRRKEFMVRNFAVSGVSSQDYFSRVSALTENVTKLQIELAAAERSRDAYRRELAAEDPQLPQGRGSKYSDAVVEMEAGLDAHKKQLDELLTRYTEVHPDVTGKRRVIEELGADLRQRRAAEDRERAVRGRAGSAATSPVYQQLRVSLAETEARVASLRAQVAAQQRQLDEIRALAGRAPQVEAELAQLNRDYDVIRKNYDAMVARRESVSLGVKLDESSQLAEFRVIEPPRVSETPVFPSRLHLALIAMLLSIAAGIAAAIAADLMRRTFDDSASLRSAFDRPVLGTVSRLVTAQGQQAQRMQTLRFTAAVVALMVLQAIWVAWIAFKPTLH